jgi:hypothetical protein
MRQGQKTNCSNFQEPGKSELAKRQTDNKLRSLEAEWKQMIGHITALEKDRLVDALLHGFVGVHSQTPGVIIHSESTRQVECDQKQLNQAMRC